MRKNLLALLTPILALLSSKSFSQVTQLSNNTNLTTGIVINGKGLLISDNDSLWVTDGSPAGTMQLTNTVKYVDTGGLAVFQGKLFFSGDNPANGSELWVTDATAGGTTLIKDINPGPTHSNPEDFVLFNNMIFFVADNGTAGRELWTSDGTPGGTQLFKDINPGAASAFTDFANFYELNGFLYFVATDGTNGEELWRTNGTAAGTTMVKNITAGAGSTNFLTFSSLGSTLVFAIQVGDPAMPQLTQLEIWRSDGSSPGTIPIKNFGDFSGPYTPSFLLYNNKLYFMGTEFTTTGSELWVTDATPAGTMLVKNINPGAAGSNPMLFSLFTFVFNNKFYFQATTAANGTELWVSDGTEGGTQLFKDINPGSGSSNPFIFQPFDFSSSTGFSSTTRYNGKLFLMASNGTNGNELWITDGTPDGTTMVKDIRPGSQSALGPFGYLYTTSGLYFVANNGTNGTEIWTSNGTEPGTTQVAEVNPSGNADPRFIFIFNNQLFFNANNGDNTVVNTDLFKLDAPLQILPVTMLNFSLTKQASNAVKVDWATANELNSSHYIVERSVDGINYTELGKVNARENSSTKQSYSYVDVEAGNLSKPVLYYRLKMFNKDGSFKHTNTLKVNFGKTNFQFTFMPNPVQNQLTVTVSTGGAKSIAMRITDATGRQVYNQTLPAAQTTFQQNINVERLQKGMYFIQIISDNTLQTQQFIKQ